MLKQWKTYLYDNFLKLNKIEDFGDLYEKFISENQDLRKKQGVFYTPKYIVDYIVKNTVEKLIENKTPDEISKIKILDPSCGSGFFLIGTYNYLLDFHLNYYLANISENSNLFLTYENKLTNQEKKRILLNNIYGVDIDFQATEVTKFVLFLKIFEDETDFLSKKNFDFFINDELNFLNENIKCGNSLISPDFYTDNNVLSQIEIEKINAFDWNKSFANILNNNGFDCIIGNPPYGAELSKIEQKYFEQKYKIGNSDTSALFLIQTHLLLKNNGLNMYIIPKAFTYASNWLKTRTFLLNDITEIVDCSKVWKDVNLEMCILKIQKNSNSTHFESSIRKDFEFNNLAKIDKKLCQQFNFILNGLTEKEINLGVKLKQTNQNFNQIISNKRGAGLQKFVNETGELKILGGKNISRYRFGTNNVKKIDKSNIDNSQTYINSNSILVQNIVSFVNKPFDCIQIRACFPKNKENYVILDTINQLTNISNYDIFFILGIINSKLISWYVYNFVFAHAKMTMHFDGIVTGKIPFPNIDLNNFEEKENYLKLIKLVEKMLELKENKQFIDFENNLIEIESQIEKIVYKFYNLTFEEILIINPDFRK